MNLKLVMLGGQKFGKRSSRTAKLLDAMQLLDTVNQLASGECENVCPPYIWCRSLELIAVYFGTLLACILITLLLSFVFVVVMIDRLSASIIT